MKFTIANALTIIDKYKVESTKKMGMTFNNPCNSCTNLETIPKDQMVAMLTEIQLEIKELDSRAGYDGNGMPTFSTDYIRKEKVNNLIQQKINKLRGEELVVDVEDIEELPPVTPQELKCKNCRWWKDSDGNYRRGCGVESQCPINTMEVYKGEGYCYMFSPKEGSKE